MITTYKSCKLQTCLYYPERVCTLTISQFKIRESPLTEEATKKSQYLKTK